MVNKFSFSNLLSFLTDWQQRVHRRRKHFKFINSHKGPGTVKEQINQPFILLIRNLIDDVLSVSITAK
ncbi:hypothetical protein EFY79_01060 [Hanamia caeni]|jgi:hypothetical protein|uniref:Uncharacterized protein n=1 Tax=Hanamia caeni TaxID=2294116 RepID=A0A3M9NQ40_9BACT|nr:hypothetical protein EFY79_01060 [Hanamia caeni]